MLEMCKLAVLARGIDPPLDLARPAKAAVVSDATSSFPTPPALSGFGFEFRVSSSRVSGFGVWVLGFGFQVSGFGLRVSGLVSSFGIQVSGSKKSRNSGFESKSFEIQVSGSKTGFGFKNGNQTSG
jgi:hypothetical protein